MGHIIFTLVRNDGQKPNRQKGVGYFQTLITDSASGTRWKIEIPTEGTISCCATDENGSHKCAAASIHLYAPRNTLVPGPGEVGMEADRRPARVATVGGSTVCLQRGFAAILHFGPATLVVSWDYPEFEHPKIES